MPTMSPASMTSRRTMMKAPIKNSLRDHLALGAILMELAEEIVGSGDQRPETHDPLAAARHHLLDPQRLRFELFRRCVLVVDGERDPLPSGDMQLGRRKLVIFDHDRRLSWIRGQCHAGRVRKEAV